MDLSFWTNSPWIRWVLCCFGRTSFNLGFHLLTFASLERILDASVPLLGDSAGDSRGIVLAYHELVHYS